MPSINGKDYDYEQLVFRFLIIVCLGLEYAPV